MTKVVLRTRGRSCGSAFLVLAALLLPGLLPGFGPGEAQAMVQSERRIYAEVVLAGNPPERIEGPLLAHDGTSVRIRVVGKEREILWADMVPNSAFRLKERLTDRTDAGQVLELGRFAWQLGMERQARAALARAERLDASLAGEARSILSGKPGGGLQPGQPEMLTPTPPGERPGGFSDAAAEGFRRPTAAPGARGAGHPAVVGGGALTFFELSTPEQDAEAMAAARQQAARVAERFEITLTEIETAHFILFTDWDAREHAFLEKNFEGAYRAVAQQFDLPHTQNIFVGKLPVFMFDTQRNFTRFAEEIDGLPIPGNVAGYYADRGQGFGHMVMWKPDARLHGGDIRLAERMWAYTLTHEFTHAFVARYRSNARIPIWLNEGIAEVVASSQFDLRDRWAYQMAGDIARSGRPIAGLFEADMRPDEGGYAVVRTLVEFLARGNKKKFIAFFNDIKAGKEPEEALMDHYNTNFMGLEVAWRQWAKSLR
ncbi:MAG: peptidase MA family metallohydrolase [Phycisphaerae bacterium]